MKHGVALQHTNLIADFWVSSVIHSTQAVHNECTASWTDMCILKPLSSPHQTPTHQMHCT